VYFYLVHSPPLAFVHSPPLALHRVEPQGVWVFERKASKHPEIEMIFIIILT
jgi:hypothetical protein